MVFRRNSGRSRVLSAFLKMTGSAILGEILGAFPRVVSPVQTTVSPVQTTFIMIHVPSLDRNMVVVWDSNSVS